MPAMVSRSLGSPICPGLRLSFVFESLALGDISVGFPCRNVPPFHRGHSVGWGGVVRAGTGTRDFLPSWPFPTSSLVPVTFESTSCLSFSSALKAGHRQGSKLGGREQRTELSTGALPTSTRSRPLGYFTYWAFL